MSGPWIVGWEGGGCGASACHGLEQLVGYVTPGTTGIHTHLFKRATNLPTPSSIASAAVIVYRCASSPLTAGPEHQLATGTTRL
jgi:hypothetical protein